MVTIKTGLDIYTMFNKQLNIETLEEDFHLLLYNIKNNGMRKWALVEEQQTTFDEIVDKYNKKEVKYDLDLLLKDLRKALFGDE